MRDYPANLSSADPAAWLAQLAGVSGGYHLYVEVGTMRTAGSRWTGALRTATAGLVCAAMIVTPVMAQAPVERSAYAKGSKGQIQGEDRVLHLLNRLTFGPRPGDVEAVARMGMAKWFDQQLNPASIDDSGLDARLAEFPAVQMPQMAMMQHFPPPQVIRQLQAKGGALPGDREEHALYADQIAFKKIEKARRETAEASTTPAAGGAMQQGMDANPAGMAAGRGKPALPGDGVDPSDPSMAAHEEELYSGLEAVKVINLPPDQRVQRILSMKPAELIAFRQSLSRSELAELVEGLSPAQRELLTALQGSERVVGPEVLQTRLLRDIYSDRQLEAVMTDFWLNHFNVYLRKNQDEPFLLPAYERDTIRAHALGSFEDLLVATAVSPAMMLYLDNWQSIGPDSLASGNGAVMARYGMRFRAEMRTPQPRGLRKDRGLNENYARELMELHTLGVACEVSADHPASALDPACGKGYTQKDVTEVAKVLSGWTIGPPAEGAGFRFDERRHEPGAKTVLGKTIHENGGREGLELLHMLATSPATAKFISTKLAVRFVSDTPPPALIDRMTKAWMASGGNIRSVLRAMVSAPEFWSTDVYRAKVKTPLEFVVSAVRAGDVEVTNAMPLVQALDRLGMPLYGMQTPNGYSWLSEPWVSTGALVNRMNFALVLSGDRMAGSRTEWAKLLGEDEAGGLKTVGMATDGSDESPAVKEQKLEKMLLDQPASEKTRTTVLDQFRNVSAQDQAEKNFRIRASDPERMAGALPGGNVSTPQRQMVQPQQKLQGAPQDRQAAVMAGLLLGSPEFQRR